MANTYEDGLRGTEADCSASQKIIAKYFSLYGSSGLQDASKHQLIYATRVMHSIAKSDLKHPKIYCDIICQIFGDNLKPEAGAKYWDAYIDSLRFFHYNLATKREHNLASQIYNHVSLYNNKLVNESVCFKLVNIFSYHLILQNSLLSTDKRTAQNEANLVLENLTYLFQEMLEKNKQLQYKYLGILRKSIQFLFPRSGQSSSMKFFNFLPEKKVFAMFESLFKLATQQRMPSLAKEEVNGLHLMESLYTLLQFDIMSKFRLQLSVQLLNYCRLDRQLMVDTSMSEFYLLLYEFMKLVTLQSRVTEFPRHFIKRCQRFKELFDKYSKTATTSEWFQDFLVVLSYLLTQLQSTTIFSCFWEQMSSPQCFYALLELLLDTMKLSPCITSETSLNWINCCSSFRKHIILSFSQIALSTFVLYCQNIGSPNGSEDKEEDNNTSEVTSVSYNEGVHKTLTLIVNHAFKVIDKMDCITSTSQDINHLITRYKQATVNAKNENQANTCMTLCELFLKIKTKIPDKEWPLILRRLYKIIDQCMPSSKWNLKREFQMFYIVSMFQITNEIDFTQIKAQITNYYSQGSHTLEDNIQQDTNGSTKTENFYDKCLLHEYNLSKNALKPHMSCWSKKRLHWMEMRHIVKYHKANEKLMHSLIQYSQTHYDFVLLARMENGYTPHCLPKLLAIQKLLKSKAEGRAGDEHLSRLEQLTYGHACTAMLQDQKNVLFSKTTKMESKDFVESQLDQLLTRKDMEAITIRKELAYVKLAYVAIKAFEDFYVRFDQEFISSDEALIDWEAITEDIIALAQFLQLAGYIEYSSIAWLLLYHISKLLQDQFSLFRALAFICEYSEYYDNNNRNLPLDIEREIESNLPLLTDALKKLNSLSKRKETYVLTTTIQIAYFYGCCKKYSYAQMLLQFVEQKHNESPDRQGKYDVIMCTLDIVQYRLLWKHGNGYKNDKRRLSIEDTLFNQSLLLHIEQSVDRFKNFVCLSSNESLVYIVLLCNLLQDISECSANRLYDNFMSNLFPAVCKCAFSHGLALRMVQLMTSWMWINLQMEFVDEAYTKLRIIDYVMGVASLKEIEVIKMSPPVSDIKTNCLLEGTPSIDNLYLNHNSAGIEATRRLTQAQLSPIKTGKLQLNTVSRRKHDLKNYFTYKIEMTSIPNSELFEWLYFIVACFNARLNFLIEDFVQLEEFYSMARDWLESRKNVFHLKFFKHFPLLAMQHYGNVLRSLKKYDKAEQCLSYGLELSENIPKYFVDPVYRLNFKLQNISSRKLKTELHTFNLRTTKENKTKYDEAKEAIKMELLQQAKSSSSFSTKNAPKTVKATATVPTNNSSGNSSPEIKNNKVKTKLKFNICTDSIEIFDLANINQDVKKDKEKITKAQSPEEKTETKNETKIRASKNVINHKKSPIASIDLVDSPPPPTLKSISLSSSNSSSSNSLDTKENNQPIESDFVKQMENLNIIDTKKKTTTATIKGRLRKLPTVTKSVIVIDDSPNIKTPLEKLSTRSARKPTIEKEVVTVSQKNPMELNSLFNKNDKHISATQSNRRRKIIKENSQENINHLTSSSSSSVTTSNPTAAASNPTALATTTTGVSSRRRQKI